MKWIKSPDFLVQAFDHNLPIAEGVQRRPMFGYPCAFVNGHLFCGLHRESLIVRVSEERQRELLAQGGSPFEPMPGKPMAEYVVVPADIVGDRERLRALLREALEHASSLAPKEPAAPKARAKPIASPKAAPAPVSPPKRAAKAAAPAKPLPPAKKAATKPPAKATKKKASAKTASTHKASVKRASAKKASTKKAAPAKKRGAEAARKPAAPKKTKKTKKRATKRAR